MGGGLRCGYVYSRVFLFSSVHPCPFMFVSVFAFVFAFAFAFALAFAFVFAFGVRVCASVCDVIPSFAFVFPLVCVWASVNQCLCRYPSESQFRDLHQSCSDSEGRSSPQR